MAELPKVDLESKDLVAERIERLIELFPEIAADASHHIDFEMLRAILGDAIDDSDERYAFTWPGKNDAIRLSQTTTTATLRPKIDDSLNWETTANLYIEGDNLEVLKLLQRAYFGKIKVIYIDPPYNTGHDFVYHDAFGSGVDNYREQANLTGQSNADTSGRYHSDWCSMLYPRLKLARELLTSDGAILVSIGEEESANLRKMLDELFGENNRAAEFAIIRAEGGGLAKQVIKGHDYLFVYARDIDIFRPLGRPKDVRGKIVEKDGRRYWIQTDWLRKKFGEYGNCHYEEVLEYKGQAQLDEINAGLAEGRYVLIPQKNGMNLVGKLRDLATDASKFYSVLTQKHLNKEGNSELQELGLSGCFDYPKPVGLIRELVQGMTLMNPNDETIVLDFFSGSATTAHAVMEQNAQDGGNRRFICVQLPEKIEGKGAAPQFETICDVGEERIRRAGAKIKQAIEGGKGQLSLGDNSRVPDIGFRVFALDDSGVQQPENGQLLIDRIKPGRTDLDIIFEMMLKWGLELTYPVEEDEIEGYPVYSIAYDELICCMQPGLTTDVLEAIATRNPRRVFLLDSVIDDTIKLNALQIFKRVEERTQQKIDLRTV